jgi:hypothetical protein
VLRKRAEEGEANLNLPFFLRRVAHPSDPWLGRKGKTQDSRLLDDSYTFSCNLRMNSKHPDFQPIQKKIVASPLDARQFGPCFA